MQLFELFCQNISIQTINKRALVDGIQWELSFNGMKAYMTIYNNGNALAQGNESVLLHVLRIWTGSAQASQELSPGIVPDLNMGWKDWKEDCAALLNYHATHGIPQEEQATDNYKCTRERMFHDFMFRTASNRKKIHWNKKKQRVVKRTLRCAKATTGVSKRYSPGIRRWLREPTKVRTRGRCCKKY